MLFTIFLECLVGSQGLRQYRDQPRFPRLHTEIEDQSGPRGSSRGPRQRDIGDVSREGVRGERVRQSTLPERCHLPAHFRGGSVQRARVQENPETGEGVEEQERDEHREMQGDALHPDRSGT